MHLLVLSAFRPGPGGCLRPILAGLNAPFGAQCFPTKSSSSIFPAQLVSQCTFWCSVLSDYSFGNGYRFRLPVSMHLLVLSAFRHTQGGSPNEY